MALESHGVQFFWSTATGGTCATSATLAVGEINSFTGPAGGAAIIDITHLRSTAKEKLQGLPDEGNFTIECNLTTLFTAATGAVGGLRRNRLERKMGSFKLKTSTAVVGGDPVKVAGVGYATTLTPSGSVDDKLSLSITIEITGKTTWS